MQINTFPKKSREEIYCKFFFQFVWDSNVDFSKNTIRGETELKIPMLRYCHFLSSFGLQKYEHFFWFFFFHWKLSCSLFMKSLNFIFFVPEMLLLFSFGVVVRVRRWGGKGEVIKIIFTIHVDRIIFEFNLV